MESMGTPNSPSGLELTIGIPDSRNGGIHISPSSGYDGNIMGSNTENARVELALLDMFNQQEEVDVHNISSMELEAGEDRQPVMDGSSSQQTRKYSRNLLSQEQCEVLEVSFQENHFPNKETKQALADTIKATLKQVQAWFVSRRLRFKKHTIEQDAKELDSCKKQVESLTNENEHLRNKVQKLKKKLKELKFKEQAPSMAPPPPLPLAPLSPLPAAAAAAQQQQVMYVPVLAGLFNNREQNVATTSATTASFITQQGSVITPSPGFLPVTDAPVQPPSGGSNV